MSNDLISRSALIDELKQSGMIADNDYGNAMVDFIKKLPTAYDVDKVVEQLNKMQVYIFQGKLPDGRICHFSDAIEIVKAGGISE